MPGLLGSHLENQRPPFLKAFPVYIFNLLCVLLSTQVVDFIAVDNVQVMIFLVPFYYWVVHQPLVMPIWFVFLSGFVIDVFVGGFLGLHAFLFVASFLVLYRIRRIILSQPLLYQAVVYAVMVVFFEIIQWILVCLITFDLWEFWSTLFSIVLNIVVYMPLVLVLKALHRIMSGYGRSSF